MLQIRKTFFRNLALKTRIFARLYAKNKCFHKNENHYFYFIFLSQKRPSEKKRHFLNWFGAQSPLLNQNGLFSINLECKLFPNPVFVAKKWKCAILIKYLLTFHYYEICMPLRSWFEALFNLSSNAFSFADSPAQIE